MMFDHKTRWIIKSAATAVLLVSPLALAQQRVGNDGRALDANNRIDSGGYNSGGIPGNLVVNGNNIVTGNVTGGREFRGNVPYTDQREFRGNVGGQDFDRFIARSAGAPEPYSTQTFTSQPEPFYGRRLATLPPQGFIQQGFTGTYVPSAAAVAGTAIDNRLNTRLEPPKPSDLMLPGPIDPETNLPTMLSASPLLGVRQWKSTDPEDRDYLRNFSPLRQDSALDRLRMDPLLVKQMREELLTEIDEKTGQKIEDKRPGQISSAVQQPFETPQNDPLRNRINGSLTDKPLPGEIRAEGTSWRRVLLPPSKQSTQYAELERRLRRYYEDRLVTDEDKNREYLKQLRARDAADQAAATTGGPAIAAARNQAALNVPDYARIGQELANQKAGPGAAPDAAAALKTPIIKPKPIKITSLAAGVQAPGLAKLLKSAEDLLKEGKFGPALDQYEAAAQLAPNNSMVLLGQANAELAIGFYRKAEQHLRTALRGDPVLMMAQFDLKAMLGEDKLNAIVKDLKDIAFKNEKDAGVALLLAYIAYNTGNEQGAAMYLDLAQKRSEGRDDLPKILRQHWDVPAGPTTRPVP
ncbi:MAG TPA: tetratricopeptide repeat protein [Tepidisphaeraceae bacterium]|jgi:tetratricopeptide (TPR) repeat protein|nr:tetratricopeptide repeat protein [Tepidisphaeraceae bacterium]